MAPTAPTSFHPIQPSHHHPTHSPPLPTSPTVTTATGSPYFTVGHLALPAVHPSPPIGDTDRYPGITCFHSNPTRPHSALRIIRLVHLYHRQGALQYPLLNRILKRLLQDFRHDKTEQSTRIPLSHYPSVDLSLVRYRYERQPSRSPSMTGSLSYLR
jgi:hypothetical protein